LQILQTDLSKELVFYRINGPPINCLFDKCKTITNMLCSLTTFSDLLCFLFAMFLISVKCLLLRKVFWIDEARNFSIFFKSELRQEKFSNNNDNRRLIITSLVALYSSIIFWHFFFNDFTPTYTSAAVKWTVLIRVINHI